MRENDKALRKVTRDVERDRRELEREEKKLEAEIKKAAKMGNKQAATVLAKQLINVRKQKTRTYNMSSKVGMGFRHWLSLSLLYLISLSLQLTLLE